MSTVKENRRIMFAMLDMSGQSSSRAEEIYEKLCDVVFGEKNQVPEDATGGEVVSAVCALLATVLTTTRAERGDRKVLINSEDLDAVMTLTRIALGLGGLVEVYSDEG